MIGSWTMQNLNKEPQLSNKPLIESNVPQDNRKLKKQIDQKLRASQAKQVKQYKQVPQKSEEEIEKENTQRFMRNIQRKQQTIMAETDYVPELPQYTKLRVKGGRISLTDENGGVVMFLTK